MGNPFIVTPLPDRQDEPEAVVSFSIAANFGDDESNGPMTYSASGLPSGLSINSTTGDITGSTSVTGTHAITVTYTAPGAVTRQATFSIIVQGAPSSAQTYHVNGATGNDSWTGLSATFTSGTTGPWATIARADQVQPHASGHVEISVAPGTYRHAWTPQYSGTDGSHRIKLRAASDGVVSIKGPTADSRKYGITWIGRNWMEIVRDSATRYVEVDGEVEFGTGSGQISKGQAPVNGCHVELGILLDNSNNNIVDLHLRRLGGDYNAVHILNNVTGSNIYRVSIDQSGTPYFPDGADSGDGIAIWRNNPSAVRSVYDGGTTGRLVRRVGHDPMRIGAGSGCIRGFTIDNSWGGVPTFSASQPDGNRCGELVAHDSTDVHVYNMLFQRNGMPQDGQSANIVEMVKLYGTRPTLSDSVFRNSRMQFMLSESAEWTHHARNHRVSHCVFDTGRGPLVWLYNWPSPDNGQTPLFDFVMKNCIARNVASNPRVEWTDQLFVIELYGISSWTSVFPNGICHGLTVQDSTRDFDDLYITIVGGGAPGQQTVNHYLTNYSSMFSNWTHTTDANLDNAPAPASDATLTSINTEYLPVSDSLSIGQGVHLTTVSGSDTGSGTSLIVNDAKWFDNPTDGNPGFGPHSVAGFMVNVNGTNREYTAINYSTNTLTMAAGFSRSAGQSVNRKIASGSAPNRGLRASN